MSEPMTIGPVSPLFIVRSLDDTIRHYVDSLGFAVRFTTPERNPFFAIVGRGSAQIFLKVVSNTVLAQPNHTRDESVPWDAFVFVEDPDSLAEEFASKKLDFHAPLGDRDDGLRGFEVRDPDGYVLFFGRTR